MNGVNIKNNLRCSPLWEKQCLVLVQVMLRVCRKSCIVLNVNQAGFVFTWCRSAKRQGWKFPSDKLHQFHERNAVSCWITWKCAYCEDFWLQYLAGRWFASTVCCVNFTFYAWLQKLLCLFLTHMNTNNVEYATHILSTHFKKGKHPHGR